MEKLLLFFHPVVIIYDVQGLSDTIRAKQSSRLQEAYSLGQGCPKP